MSPAPTMTFPFQELSDAKGLTTFRPVIPLRPMSAPLGSYERCFVDTGSPNTYLDWRLRRWRESTSVRLRRFQTLNNGVSEASQPKSYGPPPWHS
jgi:hypothetical protein